MDTTTLSCLLHRAMSEAKAGCVGACNMLLVCFDPFSLYARPR